MPLSEFHEPDDPIGNIGTVGDFWRWAMSDLVGNRNRGILAEYIVARLIGADLSHPRIEWDCYDLEYRDHRIEVKSSAYIQSWHKANSPHSTLNFGVAPHTCWDARSDEWHDQKKRWADAYVFCVFPANPQTPNPDVLDIDQWRFYVTSTRHLESHIGPDTKSIGISWVRDICGNAVTQLELKDKVDEVLA